MKTNDIDVSVDLDLDGEGKTEQPQTLGDIFALAEAKRAGLESSFESSSSPAYLNDLDAALRNYESCLRAINVLSLFSDNESLDDVVTSYLPYLLVDYHVACLVQKKPSTSPSSRTSIIAEARAAFERFLSLAESYGLLNGIYTKLYARYLDDRHGFSTLDAESDPTARRNSKIANFRAEKDLKARMATLQQSQTYVEQGGDEDLVRQQHLATAALCTHMAFQGLEGLNREEEVLAQATVPLLPQATSVEEDERMRQRQGEGGGGDSGDGRREGGPGPDGYSDRLDPPLRRLHSLFGAGGGPLLTTEGKPLQPFTLVATREELRKGVFQPSHNLPTMSIDEYLAEERRRGNIIEGGGEASMRREELDEDNVDRADAETMKAREWDEFKDENPRGWGNTLNRG